MTPLSAHPWLPLETPLALEAEGEQIALTWGEFLFNDGDSFADDLPRIASLLAGGGAFEEGGGACPFFSLTLAVAQ